MANSTAAAGLETRFAAIKTTLMQDIDHWCRPVAIGLAGLQRVPLDAAGEHALARVEVLTRKQRIAAGVGETRLARRRSDLRRAQRGSGGIRF